MLTENLFAASPGAVAEPVRLPIRDAQIDYFSEFADERLASEWFAALMREGAVAWRQDSLMMYGRAVRIPRLNAWYGDAGLNYSYSGIPMNPQPWSGLLAEIRARAEAAARHRFTSALVNLYRDGRDSVAWHADDEPELGSQPVIASLSLGVTREFQMRHRHYRENGLATQKILLHSGSLLVMRGDTQRNWLHQVPKRSASVVSGPRINITFRTIYRT